MAIQTFSVPLGGRVINAAGNFIRYESAGLEGADQRIKIRVDGNDLGEYLPGDAIELPYEGTFWEIVTFQTSATLKVGKGRITTVRSTIAGSVSIGGPLPARGVSITTTQKTVGVGTGQLVAANPNRRYLLIQNKDQNGVLSVVTGAGPATLANGLEAGPKGSLEWDGSGTVPTDAIQAIGSVAAMNVIVMEG